MLFESKNWSRLGSVMNEDCQGGEQKSLRTLFTGEEDGGPECPKWKEGIGEEC